MNLHRFLWLVALCSSITAASGAVNETSSGAGSGPVVVIPLTTEVSQAQFFFLRRALKEAERNQASAFVIDMSTYGGDVQAAINNMEALLKTSVPTYTYVNPRAISAGALIALATQRIYMAPGGVMGASAPVMAGGEDLPKTMTDKTVSMLSAVARSAAQKNGHNPEIAEAFIRKEKEVKVGDTVINKGDSLLTLSAEEAARNIEGKPLLAVGVASSLADMLSAAGLNGPLQRVEPTGFERLASWITTLAPLFLLGGILGAYVEFKTPGFGLPGILSLCCFGTFFTGHYLAGLAGWEVAFFFAIGVALVLGELILHPGTILPGVAGVMLMLGSLIYAMVDRYPSEPFWPSSEMLFRPMINLVIAFFLSVGAAALLAKYLPRTSFYQRIVLGATVPSGPLVSEPIAMLGLEIGERGASRTVLRPSGKAEFGGKLYDVVSQGDMLDSGVPIRVRSVEGLKIVVEAA